MIRLLSCLSVVAASVTVADPSLAVERPHLVLFLSDDHGAADSSVAGDPHIATPNLERIAREGMTFTHAFAVSPSCAPSRAALLTGLMPVRNGAMLNHQPPRGDVKKLPAYLREFGYEIVAFGKVAHYRQAKDYGFDLVAHDTFHDARCIPAALEYLARRTDPRPLCLCVGTNWPHVPWPEETSGIDPAALKLPPKHIDTPATRAWRARYCAAIARYDADLGAIYDAAFARLGGNTLFLHASDHGAQWPFGKWNLYDSGIRVPLFAVWPDVVAPGSSSGGMVSLIDVLPTFVEAAGGKPPGDIDGQSFLDVLRGQKTARRERIFTTHSRDGQMNVYPVRSVRSRDWKYIRNLSPDTEHTTHIDKGKSADGSGYWGSWVERARTDQAAEGIVHRYFHRPGEELYDLRSDPDEMTNLIDDPEHAATAAMFRGELDRWMAEQGDRGLDTEREFAASFLRPAEDGGKPAQ